MLHPRWFTRVHAQAACSAQASTHMPQSPNRQTAAMHRRSRDWSVGSLLRQSLATSPAYRKRCLACAGCGTAYQPAALAAGHAAPDRSVLSTFVRSASTKHSISSVSGSVLAPALASGCDAAGTSDPSPSESPSAFADEPCKTTHNRNTTVNADGIKVLAAQAEGAEQSVRVLCWRRSSSSRPRLLLSPRARMAPRGLGLQRCGRLQ